MRDLESLFLRIAKPTGNRHKGSFARATRQNDRFKSEIWRIKRGEISQILGTEPGKPRASKKITKPTPTQGRKVVLAPYAGKGFAIRMTYKGKTIKARVRSDGMIEYEGVVYTSPSVAGARAIGRRSLNGWKAWKFRDQKGEWVRLDELRKTGRRKIPSTPADKRLDTIICITTEEGFQDTFVGKNRWYAIRINPKKIPTIRYIAMYRMRPVSAVTHYARVDRIVRYKRTNKYLVTLAGKPKRLRKPVQRKHGDWAPRASFFGNLKTIRSGIAFENLRPTR
jgi:hypothetical protein